MTNLPHPILDEAVRYILDGPHLSVLATTDADGKPQTSVIFVKRDGDEILFSTIKGRRKTINMTRDPRVNLLIHGLPVDRPNYAGDGPNYATICGTAKLTDDPNGVFHQEMYDIHMGGATPPPEPDAQRVIVRIVPQRTYVPTFPGPASTATSKGEASGRPYTVAPCRSGSDESHMRGSALEGGRRAPAEVLSSEPTKHFDSSYGNQLNGRSWILRMSVQPVGEQPLEVELKASLSTCSMTLATTRVVIDPVQDLAPSWRRPASAGIPRQTVQ